MKARAEFGNVLDKRIYEKIRTLPDYFLFRYAFAVMGHSMDVSWFCGTLKKLNFQTASDHDAGSNLINNLKSIAP